MTSVTALGLEAARATDPAAYRISGVAPRLALRPTTADEVAEALRACAADDLKVVPWGGGVSLHMVAVPERYDLALDLTALDRIVEYDADDLTITAECGVSLDALRSLLAARNQELPLEGSRSERATLGGVLAANTSGPRRLRFGAPVDRVLGARFALGDGTLARSGGRVVKNVAGYAIHRALCGSRGGLGILIEASLKLSPQPDARVCLIYGMDAREVGDAARWRGFPRLEPAALSIVGRELARTLHIATPTPSDFVVIVGFEEHPARVNEQVALTMRALGEPVARLEGADVLEMWQALADLEEQPAPRLSFTTASKTPDALSPLLDASDLEGAVFHAPAGRLHLHVEPRAAGRVANVLAENGFVRVDARGIEVKAAGSTPASRVASLRAALAVAFDPAGRLALGAATRAAATVRTGTTP